MVFKYSSDRVFRQAGRISRIILVNYKIKAVIAIEPIVCANPHKAPVILQDTCSY